MVLGVCTTKSSSGLMQNNCLESTKYFVVWGPGGLPSNCRKELLLLLIILSATLAAPSAHEKGALKLIPDVSVSSS